MASIAKVLKQEIERISQQQARRTAIKWRKELAAVKAGMVKVRRELSALRKKAAAPAVVAAKTAESKVPQKKSKGRGGITSKGIVSLRKRLGLTQIQFAKLAGVSAQAVNIWEHKDGPLRLRAKTAEAIADITPIGKREAMKRLGMDSAEEAAPAPKTPGRKKTVAKKTSKKKAVRKATAKKTAKTGARQRRATKKVASKATPSSQP